MKSPGAIRGFTLIELMVVLLIIGIAASMIAINGLPGAREGLRYEAERVSHLLLLAREEAQIRGAPIRFEADETRYRFMIYKQGEWLPILDDRDLRERRWELPTRVRVARPDGRTTIEFGRASVDTPFTIFLSRENSTSEVFGNGLGAFEVREANVSSAARQ